MSGLDFQRDVIERSHTVPVVVDFWAAWCAPCRVLGPILEELATEAAGRWVLVKVDTEAHPDLARQFDIRGIPAVKLFRGGRLVGEFLGALPREEVRSWLDRLLPDPTSERLHALAEEWPERGEAVAAPLEAFLDERPESTEAKLRLAQAVVARDPARARELVEQAVSELDVGELAGLAELADDVRSLADLMQIDGELPVALAPHLRGARASLLRHDLDATLEQLVEAATLDRSYRDEVARRAAIALFHLIGQDHELTRKHQRRLASALLS